MNQIATRPNHAAAPPAPLPREAGHLTEHEVLAQVRLIQAVMRGVMKEGEDYGVVPGTGGKPTLFKPGAEKLCLTFRLAPSYVIEREQDGPHREVVSTCTLTHIPGGRNHGSGMGSCSTRESKYAWRKAARKCPACGREAIIKGKQEYGGGWVCFKAKDGCGAKFRDGDAGIEAQPVGRVPNDDLADVYNTVLKLANKRSLVAAVLNATAASSMFTQDAEDFVEEEAPAATPRRPQAAPEASREGPEPQRWPTPEELDALSQELQAVARLDDMTPARLGKELSIPAGKDNPLTLADCTAALAALKRRREEIAARLRQEEAEAAAQPAGA